MFSPGAMPSVRATPSTYRAAKSTRGRLRSESRSQPASLGPSRSVSHARSHRDRHPYLVRDEQQMREVDDQPAPTVHDIQVAEQEKMAIDMTEKVVKLKLLTQHGFPDLVTKKRWGNEAYGEAFVAANLCTSLFSEKLFFI